MPYYYFNEIWTPLKLIGIRLYRDEQRALWIKFWHAKKRRLRAQTAVKDDSFDERL